MFRILYLTAVAVLVVIDRVSKSFAVKAFGSGETEDFLFGLFQFRYVENTGAAFSSFSNNKIVLVVFTSLVIILCLYLLVSDKVKSNYIRTCLIMIVSGGIGNLIDRFSSGYVVDFIEPLFIDFAVFNVADIFITVGAFMLIIYEIYLLIKEKRQNVKTDNDD